MTRDKNKDEMFRSYLMLHPDTPIDMKEYAFPLRIIKQLVEAAVETSIKSEREACAKLCEDLTEWHSKTVTAALDSAAENIRARSLDVHN